MGTDSAGGTLRNVRTREIKGQMMVVLRTVPLALFAVPKKVVERREETEAKQKRVQKQDKWVP